MALNTKITRFDTDSGTRTITWSNQNFGYYIAIGLYTIDNLFGPGNLVITGVPAVNP
jgi:hypothetical protein